MKSWNRLIYLNVGLGRGEEINQSSFRIYSRHLQIISVYFKVLWYHFMYNRNLRIVFLHFSTLILWVLIIINIVSMYVINPTIFYVLLKRVIFFKDLNNKECLYVVTIFGALCSDSEFLLPEEILSIFLIGFLVVVCFSFCMS